MKKLLAATALATMVPFAASALTVDFLGGTGGTAGTVLTGSGSVAQDTFITPPTGASVDFTWLNTEANYLAYSEFTVTGSFLLTFDDYRPERDTTAANARSGFQLFLGSKSMGEALTAMIDPTPPGETPCGGDVFAAFGTTDCVLVTGAGNVGTSFVVPKSVFGPFAGPATFTLIFSEGNDPTSGSAEFLISEVPIPAAGFLLLGGLGGLAALKRRKKA